MIPKRLRSPRTIAKSKQLLTQVVWAILETLYFEYIYRKLRFDSQCLSPTKLLLLTDYFLE